MSSVQRLSARAIWDALETTQLKGVRRGRPYATSLIEICTPQGIVLGRYYIRRKILQGGDLTTKYQVLHWSIFMQNLLSTIDPVRG